MDFQSDLYFQQAAVAAAAVFRQYHQQHSKPQNSFPVDSVNDDSSCSTVSFSTSASPPLQNCVYHSGANEVKHNLSNNSFGATKRESELEVVATTLGYPYNPGGGVGDSGGGFGLGGRSLSSVVESPQYNQQQLAVAAAAAAAVKSAALKMDLTTAYRYNQNMMEYYTCKSKLCLDKVACSISLIVYLCRILCFKSALIVIAKFLLIKHGCNLQF